MGPALSGKNLTATAETDPNAIYDSIPAEICRSVLPFARITVSYRIGQIVAVAS